ncbi:hypothetical protein BDZ97DRAFT_376774 [Flammula alnicola]|nr:hypothetical protein BDZ97DRAFT_376774 [Flammula alnicola]
MSIDVAPASSSSRGEVVLQPNYFTSSVYVKALRDDISTLVLRYHEAYHQPGVTKPFSLFKTVWLSMGWNWLQFRVFDDRSQRTVKTEAPFTRAVALFGMYLFFYSQVKDSAPALYCLTNIPIPCDHYASLNDMAESLSSPSVVSLQTYVRYVLSCLKKDRVFLILPKSDLGAMNPRELPRELYAEDGIAFSEVGTQKRKGRPARREKGKKARLALEGLDDWLSQSPVDDEHASEMTAISGEYQALKTLMLNAVDEGGALPAGGIEEVNREVLERLKEARELVDGREDVGIRRLEQVIEGMSSGGAGIFELCN